MTERRNSAPGLHPLHYCIVLGDNFFPPSEFAIAQIGVASKKEIRMRLEEVIDQLLKERINPDEVPVFAEWVQDYGNGEDLFSINDLMGDLEARARRHYSGSTKIISQKALLPVNRKNGNIGTRSQHDTFSFKVDSREFRNQQHPYRVELYRPITRFGPQYSRLLMLAGGSPHADNTHARGNHWTFTHRHDAGFLIQLESHIEDYIRRASVSDYPRACALIALDQIVRGLNEGDSIANYSPQKRHRVVLPFDFNDHWHYVFEAFLRRHPANGKQPNLFEIDQFFIGKGNEIVSPLFLDLRRYGTAHNGVLLHTNGRHFPSYSWTIIQAWEKHMYDKGRKFSGYALEFPGTEYETVSIVFDRPEDDLSIRIIYNENFGLPYLMYKDSGDAAGLLEGRLGPLRGNPANHVSHQEYIDPISPKKMPFTERDPRTGKAALVTIKAPKEHILQQASKFSERLREISVSELKSRYYNNMQKLRAA